MDRNLTQGFSRWATEPADHRFWSLADLIERTRGYAMGAKEITAPFPALGVAAQGDDLALVGPSGGHAALTHYAMGQVSKLLGLGPDTLRKLPARIAADALNWAMSARGESAMKRDAQVLIHPENGGYVTRAVTTDIYQRVWNYQTAERLRDHLPAGWRVPPARPPGNIPGLETRKATEADVLDSTGGGFLSVKVGDTIAPAGVYASDHDMFIFMVNPERTISPVSGTHLSKGFFLWNSEVGDKSFGICTFWYDSVCGNHIVWGAEGVREVRVRHVGRQAGSKVLAGVRVTLERYADSSAQGDEQKVLTASRTVLGKSKAETIDAVLGLALKGRVSLGRKRADSAYQLAERTPRYGDPNTAWAMVSGLTELATLEPHADRRAELDRSAGKLLTLATA